ncbi:MAG: class I SAM-dependent methyltransferase [Neomegalonema sp.]|nr:class I SAM-dependent methyltransferase [Neomegalonema sp.]
MTDRSEHWENVYRTKDAARVSWFEATPDRSVELVSAFAEPHQLVIDIGGGASRLVDALLAQGFADVSVLDISAAALEVNKARLGARAADATWLVEDITCWAPSKRYALWHDRAVMHFLTEPADRAAYVERLAQALRPEGVAIIATFALDGPERCSSLPVVRYSPQSLFDMIETLAPGHFAPITHRLHEHVTPAGGAQRFQTSILRKIGS